MKWGPEKFEKAKHYLENYEGYGDAMPSVAGLAVALGIHRDTVYDWKEKHKTFRVLIERLLAEQERVLWAKGLKGDFNAAVTKLGLHNHGYSDKADTTVGGGEKPIETKWTVEFVNAPSQGQQ